VIQEELIVKFQPKYQAVLRAINKRLSTLIDQEPQKPYFGDQPVLTWDNLGKTYEYLFSHEKWVEQWNNAIEEELSKMTECKKN
jgi:hypothetical protein